MRPEERDPLHSPVLQHLSPLINPSSELRSPIALSMSEKKKTRKRSKIKRWLRSWVFTPLGNVRIKLINKVERKRRSISDWELNRIVSVPLTDRYPCRFFRDRNDQVSTPVRRSLLENEFDLDLAVPMSTQLGSPRRHQFSRLDLGVSNGPVVDRGQHVVATAHPKSPDDPRGSWRGDEHSVLKIMNPDLSDLSSVDEKVEELGPISVIEVDRNVYELSASRAISPDLPAELSGEEKQSGQSLPVWVAESDVQMAYLPVVEELAPQLPDLYFIHQPDPPLCCLITSAFRDTSSPLLFEDGICPCPHSHSAEPVVQHMPSSDMSRSSIKRANPGMTTMEFLARQTQRKRNAIVKSRYISPFVPLQPRPLKIRKTSNVTSNETQNDALPPISVETSHRVTAPVQHPPYSLRRKIQNGPLPPLPPSTHSTSYTHSSSSVAAKPSSQPLGISSTQSSSSGPATGDLPQYPDRPTSMCGGCLARGHRSLHSHPYHRRGDNNPQVGTRPLPYPLSPREPTYLPPRVDSLPTSLRAGPQCRHCTTRRSGIVSPPVLVGPRPRALNRVSLTFSDPAPDSPWAGPVGPRGFYAVSEDDLPLSVETDRIDQSIGSSGLELCLIAGSTAQNRRYR